MEIFTSFINVLPSDEIDENHSEFSSTSFVLHFIEKTPTSDDEKKKKANAREGEREELS